MTADALPAAEEQAVLRGGAIEVRGRILPASNITLLAEAAWQGHRVRCVYKPIAGERPLWDFPDGTLAGREVAAHAVSEALGWDVVPLTILRDGPAGPGMVQVWRDPDEHLSPVDLVEEGAVPSGFLHVLDAVDAEDRPVSLVHEDTAALRRMAVFDALVNNADRKGGHVLAMPDGHRYGVDHGVSFHVDAKLRTVLWGWAGETLRADEHQALSALRELLATADSALRSQLDGLLSNAEVAATVRRCDALLRTGRMPLPSADWPAIPWPAF